MRPRPRQLTPVEQAEATLRARYATPLLDELTAGLYAKKLEADWLVRLAVSPDGPLYYTSDDSHFEALGPPGRAIDPAVLARLHEEGLIANLSKPDDSDDPPESTTTEGKKQ
jgi:hypothetical protein